MSARDQMIAAIVTVLIVFSAAWAVYWLLRRCRRLASLMDDGDGQGGVPPHRSDPLAGYVAARQAAARDMLDGIVVNAEFERIAAQLHYDSVRDMLDDGNTEEWER